MKTHRLYYQPRFLLLLLLFATSCKGQGNSEQKQPGVNKPKTDTVGQPDIYGVKPDPKMQISQYVRRIFQDRTGNLWFGTNDDGVCRYDGKSLRYFTAKEGFSGKAVRGIAEDKAGNLWFGTDGGLSKYDGKHFTNFTVKNGLRDNDIWSIFIDREGVIWTGTIEGICRYDPSAALRTGSKIFTSFPIPAAVERDFSIGVTSTNVVWSMIEDRAGNIWFATNGAGAYRYDGKSLFNISQKDGLCNNFVNCILEDKKGGIWFATRHGGVSRYDGKSFTTFTKKEGLSNNDIWTLSEDKTGNLWFATNGWGVDRYDGKAFTNYKENEGLTGNNVQSIFEDKNGKLWFGFSGGLFRFNGKSFINVTKDGPWE